MVTFLIANGPGNHIAILVISRAVGIVAVYAPRSGKACVVRTWNNALQFVKLFKKTSGKIIRSTIFPRVPEIFRKPVITKPNRKWCRRWVNRNDVLSRPIAFPRKKRLLVAPSHSALLTTLRTPRRRRNFHFFVKRKILRLDRKGGFAVLTVFYFRYHITSF